MAVENNIDHEVIYKPSVTITEPTSRIDFTLKPFNRKDLYVVIMVVNRADKIEIGKSLSVRFVDAYTKDQDVKTNLLRKHAAFRNIMLPL